MTDRRLAVQAWESLFRAQHEIFTQIGRDFDGDTGLSQSEYDVLLTLTRAPDATARLRDITRHMLVSQPSVSRLIDRMVARGLVTKCGDPRDGRGALVTATDTGVADFRRVAASHARSIVDRMSHLTEGELRTLHELTAKLRADHVEPRERDES